MWISFKKELVICTLNHQDKLMAFIEVQNIDVKGKLLHPAGRNTYIPIPTQISTGGRMQQRESFYYCAEEKEKGKSRTIGSLKQAGLL